MKRLALSLPPSPFAQLQVRQQQALITVLVILTTLGVANQIVVQPLDQRRAILQEQLLAARQQAEALGTLRQSTRAVTQVHERLRSRNAITTLLQEIATLASHQNVTVNTIGPQPLQPIGQYSWLRIRIEATGNFRDLLNFIQVAEKTESLRFDDVSFARQDDLGPVSRTGSPSATVPIIQAHFVVNALLRET